MSQSRHGSSGGRRISALLFSLLSRVSGWLDAWRSRRQARCAGAEAAPATSRLQFEALEPRLLLSADLVAGSLSHNAFDPVLPGDPVSALFEVHRPDSETLSSPIRIQLYASTDSSLDAADTPLGQADIPASQLQPGANTISLSLDTHAITEPGRYALIGVIDPDDTIGESDESNNQAIATQDFNLAFRVGELPGRNPVPSIEFADADGTRVTLAISGPGIADLSTDGAGYRLTITGSNASTRVELTGSGGDGRVVLSGITAASPLGSLNAAIASLDGAATFGAVSSLVLGDIAAGARLDGNSLASLSVTRDALGDLRLAGIGVSGFVLGSAQVGGAIGGLWSISGRSNSVSAQSTRADWRANFSAPLTQLAVRGNASGQFAASALQILQVGGSVKGMDVRIGANLGSDAVLGGSGDAADRFGPGTLARLRVSGDIEDSTIVVGIDPRNGTYLDGDDQQLGTPTQRIQELLVGGQLKGTTQIVAPAFPASVRINGATVNPAILPQLTTSPPDAIAPALSATLLHDTGADPSDRLTNDPPIHGQATDAGGVRRLLVALDSTSPTLLDVSQALQVDGRFVLSDALLDMLAGGRLADGAQAIRLVAEDATGNRSAAATVSFTLDRDVATPVVQLALDSGRDDHDRITQTGTLNIVGSEAGASIEYSIDAGASWSPDFTAVEGDNSVAVRQTDLAGNVSSSGTLTFVLDTIAPAAPGIDLLATSDSGLLTDDNLTHDSTPTLALTSEAGAAITLSRGGSVVASSLVGPQADFTSEVLADGEARFFASSEDLAGNRSAAGELAITIDTLAPTLTVALANDTGAQDGITRDPTINGNAGDPLALTAFSGSFGTDLASFANLLDLVQPDGGFTIDAARLATVLGDSLTDGAHTLRLVAVDAAGNRSPIVERTFTLDTASPAFAGFGLSVSDASNAALDETSAATAQITGHAEAGAAIRLAAQNIEVLAGAGGAFVMPGVSLAPGANELTLTATDTAGNATTLQRTITRTAAVQSDAVLEWNEIALHAVQLDVTDPPVATRTLAMVSLAQYDALAAIDGTPAYLVSRSVSGPVSAPAAVAVAAHRVLSQTYPAQEAVFDGALAAGLAAIADGEAKDRGIALGLAVADAVLALRANDGSEDFVAYDGSTAIGSWRPTGPMFDVADDPQWGTVQPFALRSPDQYRPAAPPALDTAAYATAVEEVKRLGSASSSERTADQTEQALFWADGKGSYTPPGHWNQIAEEVARAQGNSLAANARLFAQLNVALADAAIACWDAKYAYGLWRPETAIQNADLDNNAATTLDNAWRPLLLTPAHPEYVSGHSSFSMAAATVLAANFGDATAFTTTSPTLPGVTRSFSSFTQAAQEAGRSRIHGGIHYEFTNQVGQQLGTQVGNAVLARFALTSDTQAPAIVLGDAPAATNTNLTLHGQVFDNLSGVATAQFQIDGGALEALVPDASGGFTITTALATDGSADGAHTIRIVAGDAAGNANAGVTRGFVLDTTQPALVLNSLADGDTLSAASRLTGTADATGSALTQLSYRIDGGTSRSLIFDGSGTFDESLAHGDLDVGNHTLLLTARDAAGNVATLSRTLTVNALAPLAVTSLTPTDGSDDVGVTVRPQVRFSRAVDVATLTTDSFYATGPDGSKLAATIVPGADGTFAWLFFTNPMPGASRVTLHVDGSRIRSAGDGSFLDADGDGTARGTLEQSFTTVSRSAVIGTTLVGKVVDPGPDLEPMSFDDIRRGPDGVIHTSDDVFLLPIAHAKVYILGQESQFVYTDADGNFELTDTPAGTVKVAVDGRTATNAPAGVFFPEMVIDVDLHPGVANTVMGGMGSAEERLANLDRREIYLPRIPTNALQPVSDTAPTVITLTDAASAPQLTEQERAALTLTVKPGSAIGEDGQVLQNVQIGMATVPPELVRDMLPPGVLQHTFDITIQAPGVATFAEPVQITFPNVFNAAPGTKLNILSFDHTTGMLVINGTGTVSADGTTVVSDPDSGIRAPGWHGVTAPTSCGGSGGSAPQPPTPSTPADTQNERESVAEAMITGEKGSLSTITWTAPDKLPNTPPTPPPSAGCPAPAAPPNPPGMKQPYLNVTIKVDGPLAKFMTQTGNLPLISQSFNLAAGSGATKTFGADAMSYAKLLGARGLAGLDRDRLYGSSISITEETGNPDGSKHTEKYRIYLYRWVDALDPDQATTGTGNTAAFFRTNVNGVERLKNVDVDLPRSVITRLDGGSASGFDLSGSLSGKTLATWKFDPDSPGDKSEPISIKVSDPKTPDLQVGNLLTIGTATANTTISTNEADYKIELMRVINALKTAFSPGADGRPGRANVDDDKNGVVDDAGEFNFVGSDDSAEVVYDYGGALTQRMLGGTDRAPGKAGIDDDGNGKIDDVSEFGFVGSDDVNAFAITDQSKVNTASTKFKASFAGFMPGDGFTAAQLSARADAEAMWMTAAVAADYASLSPSYSVVSDNAGADVKMSWLDLGQSLYGSADYDSNEAYLRPLLVNAGIGQGSKQYALAQALNQQVLNDGKFAIAINISWNSSATFSEFMANTVSHELGHTFGLNDAYLSGGGNVPPNDIMRSGSDADGNLFFRRLNVNLLKAALGLQSDGDKPLTDELLMYRRNINLPQNANGIRDPLVGAPGPELNIMLGDLDILPDWPVDFGPTAADGIGGQSTQLTLDLVNTGYLPLDLSSIALAHGDRGFSVVSTGTASSTLAEGASTTLTLTFDPTTAAPVDDTLVISSNAQASPKFRVDLKGQGVAAVPTATLALTGGNNLGGHRIGAPATERAAIATVTNEGANPLLITAARLADGANGFSLVGVPGDLATTPLSLAYGETFTIGASFEASKLGLVHDFIEFTTNDPAQPVIRMSLVGTGLAALPYPQWSENYFAVETPDIAAAQPLRVRSDTAGNFTVALPPLANYHLVAFDAVTGLVAHGYGQTGPGGGGTNLVANLVFDASTASDTDFDGLPDDIEFAIGTSSAKSDSDRDGLNDFAEVDMGLNPLDGRGLPAGVLAVTSLLGEAKEVVLAGRTDGTSGQLAYVATGSYGLAIVDPRNMLKPVVVGQLELPGDAVDVSLDSRLGLAAVATGVSLEVVDVSNPDAPRVARSIPVAAGQVEVVDGVAYVAQGSAIESYNLLTGERLQSVPSGTGSIAGLAADRGFLFAADSGRRLAAIDIRGATMVPVGGIDLPASSGKVFVGGGIAYVGGGSSGGFVTVDVSNPGAMVLLSGVDSSLMAGDAIVATGTGDALTLGTSTGGPVGGPVLSLADVRDPTRTDSLVASFRLPSSAHSVAIGSGLAFVAGGASGLVVANYRAFDTAGQRPIVTLAAPGADIDPATAGIQVPEGATLGLEVAVQDDRQVAWVELLVDGQVVISDVSYPWPGSLVLPAIVGTDDTVRVQVRAVDTGGNVGLSAPLEIQLVRDTVTPTLVATNAPDGAIRGTTFRVLTWEFSEAIDAAGVTPSTLVLSDSSGTVIAAQDLQLRRNGVELQVTYPPLAKGTYQLRLVASAITDRVGNPLGSADWLSTFTIAATNTVEWIGSGSGFWDDPANWSSGALPGPGDDVVIDVAPGGIIDHRAGSTTIRSLTANGNLRLSGGTLELTADSSIDGAFSLTGGTLAGAGSLTLAGTGNRWDGGTMTGTGTTRVASAAELLITGRLGALALADRTMLNDGSIVVDRGAAGEVVIDASGAAVIRNLGTFEFAGKARIGDATHPVASQQFENLRLLRVRAAATIAVDLNNAGTVELSAAASLNLSGAGTGISSGAFVVADRATLSLTGRYRFENTASASGRGRIDLGSSGRVTMTGGTFDVTVALADGAELSIEAPTTIRFLEMTGGAISGLGPLTITLPQSELLGGTITVPLVEPPDTVGPTIIHSSVSDGGTYGNGLGRITLRFSEPMRPDSLVAANFFLLSEAGARIDPLAFSIGPRFSSITLEVPLLVTGRYRLVAAGDKLEDHRAGNRLAGGDLTVASFSTRPTLFDGALYRTGNRPSSLVVGDVDGDGDLDIVTAGYSSSSTASVLLGNGDGSFASRVDYAGSGAKSVALGDVDGDGDLDIVTVGSSASVLLGNGDGSFATPVDYALASRWTASVALGDVDGDGDLDIVTAGYSGYSFSASASVLLGNGDGSFATPVDYALASGWTASVALGDVDGDGDLDIVTAGYSSSFTASVLLGNGDGSFATPVDYALATRWTASVALGDVDGDGDLDIVTAGGYSYSSSTASVLLGNGDGSFATPVDYALASGWTASVALGDVDGDGDLDIVTAGYSSSSTASVLLGNGDGSFASRVDYAGSGAKSVALGDVDGDGDLDIVTASYSHSSAWVLLGNGDGSFASRVDYAGSGAKSVALGDVDGDGDLDIVTVGSSASVLLGNGDGSFATPVDYFLASRWTASVALGDVDGDGDLDIVTAGYSGYSFSASASVLLGNGDGSFATPVDYALASRWTASVALGDVDVDGDLDVVMAGYSYYSGFSSSSAFVLLGNGDGSLATPVDYASGSRPWSVALGDVDVDGDLDIVMARYSYYSGYSYASVLLGNGNGSFAAPVDYASGSSARSVALGDVDVDGDLDIVMAGHSYYSGYSSSSVLLGNGDGSFAAPVDYASGSRARSVALGDVDGDGDLDIVTPGYSSSVLLGNGDGSFAAPVDYASGSRARSVALGDVDGDGDLDIVTAGDGYASVLLNRTR